MTNYFVHDNGARPFRVKVTAKSIYVYKKNDDGEDDYDSGMDDEEIENTYNELILKIRPYQKVFVGEDTSEESVDDNSPEFGRGNSILVKKSVDKYVFIGSEIISFKTNDEIISYESPIGNNDVPYPFASGIKYTYLMIDYVKVLNDLLETNDPYEQFYDHEEKYSRTKDKFKKYKIKVIQERLL